ncbi:MAG: glycosyltransferase [Phocaeicola sp.]
MKKELTRKYRFALLFPAYKEDKVILESTIAAIAQQYKRELFDIYVIADQMQTDTIDKLKGNGIKIAFPKPGESSKANALKSVAALLKSDYDYVIILDADNVIPPNYLGDVNDYLNINPCTALQTHRKAKNLTTPTAVLDAAIEEMNNSIFRLGHVRLGFSSALIGSGMVFEYNWFVSNVIHTHSAGEDKEFEEMLLRQQITIHYAEDIPFTDEKVEQVDNLSNQRRRWLATQFMLLGMMYKRVPKAILTGNWDYIVKAIQASILPRSILMGMIGMMTFITLFFDLFLFIKWGALLSLLLTILYNAIPKEMKTPLFYDAIKQIPRFILMMFINLFKLKGASKKFIHTKHG